MSEEQRLERYFEVAFSGDITTTKTLGAGLRGIVSFDACCGAGRLILASALLVDVSGAADQCFGGIYPLKIDDNWRGELKSDKQDMNQVAALFAFRGKDKTGKNTVRYKIRLAPGTAVGDNENDVFPPEPGTSMTVTYSTKFEINASRKKEKNACSSDGFIDLTNDISVVVEGIS